MSTARDIYDEECTPYVARTLEQSHSSGGRSENVRRFNGLCDRNPRAVPARFRKSPLPVVRDLHPPPDCWPRAWFDSKYCSTTPELATIEQAHISESLAPR